MADFQGKYNGEQIEQLLDKANDIDLTKYALKTDNAPTATKLQAARTIALSGAVTGSASSDFGSNITISTTLANFDASKITSGTISIDRLPKAALERLVEDILHKVIQPHTLSAEWEPGLNTASLYKVVDKEHAGTIGDPIPYFPPMEIFKDKYYIQNADVYKCTRDSGTPLSHNLEDLVGQYVERV